MSTPTQGDYYLANVIACSFRGRIRLAVDRLCSLLDAEPAQGRGRSAARAASDLTELAGLSVHVRSVPLSSVLSPRFLRR
ncbi:hypothetical protein [Burkholderia cepacia]|uniref:hypothetical protein n=1 Tax=Burkholderia cepacia TaxID=292 RepID=UPI003D67B568